MDYAEAARNYVQDDAVAFLQTRSTNFIQFRSGLVSCISVRIVQDAKYFCFPIATVLVFRPRQDVGY